MKLKKYHKPGTVLLLIVIFALLAVLGTVIFIYSKGLRYIKTPDGVKYFGFLELGDSPVNGRVWYGDGTVISVKEQKFIAIEFKNPETSAKLSREMSYDKPLSGGASFFLDPINSVISEETLAEMPMGHFLFDAWDGIEIVRENFIPYLNYLESSGNPLAEGTLTDRDGGEWTLSASKASPSSYKDFDLVKSDDKTYKYGGNLADFLNKEKINFGTLKFKKGTAVNLYGCEGISRLFYEEGANKGDVYIGKFTGGLQKSGGIHFYEKTGDIYYGDFLDGEKTGQCMMKFLMGDNYAGGILNGKREGEGRVEWSDGSSYEGEFKNGMKNGGGTEYYAGGNVYEGSFLDDYAHGTGTLRFASGDVYEGEFKDGYWSGYGVYTWASGDSYEGEFKYSMINGAGTYRWAAGRTYTGYFADGKMTYEKPEEQSAE